LQTPSSRENPRSSIPETNFNLLQKRCGRGCKPRPAEQMRFDGITYYKNVADGVANPVQQISGNPRSSIPETNFKPRPAESL